MLMIVRLVVAVGAGLFILAGLAGIAIGGAAAPTGIWLLVLGGIAALVVVFERMRYRSETDEPPEEGSGPGGDGNAPLDPRFVATPEIFIDPTTGRRMRVYLDAASGERRYRAE